MTAAKENIELNKVEAIVEVTHGNLLESIDIKPTSLSQTFCAGCGAPSGASGAVLSAGAAAAPGAPRSPAARPRNRAARADDAGRGRPSSVTAGPGAARAGRSRWTRRPPFRWFTRPYGRERRDWRAVARHSTAGRRSGVARACGWRRARQRDRATGRRPSGRPARCGFLARRAQAHEWISLARPPAAGRGKRLRVRSPPLGEFRQGFPYRRSMPGSRARRRGCSAAPHRRFPAARHVERGNVGDKGIALFEDVLTARMFLGILM